MSLAFVKEGKIVKYPIGRLDISRKFPSALLPADLSQLDLTAYGVVHVVLTPQPEIDVCRQKLEADTPSLIDGQWHETWKVVDLSESEIAGIAAALAEENRSKRNQLLVDTDWTQLTDSPLDADDKAAWALYRETLRMIPQQTGFPWNVNWPPTPGS